MTVIKNVSPLGDLDIPGVGVFAAGEEFEVPASVAGKPPKAAKGEPDDESYVPAEPGEGLLAQDTNFVPVKAKATHSKPEEK